MKKDSLSTLLSKQTEFSDSHENSTCYQASNKFAIRTIADETLLIPVGSATKDLNGLVMLNETGTYLWEILQQPKTENELVQAIINEIEIDSETALSDVKEFINKGIQNNLISYSERRDI